MTIMTVRIPEDIIAAFDKAFEGEDKDAVVARLLWEAAEKRGHGQAGDRDSARKARDAVRAVLELRKQPPYFSDAQIRQAREEGRP